MAQPAADRTGKVRHALRLDKLSSGTRRIIVSVVGFLVLLIGVAMVVLPGPAFIMIPLGFAILASEFDWAQRCCDKVQGYYRKLRNRRKK